MGLRVLEDVQVIGFDGIRMFGDQEYTVSTIVQPVQEIAEFSYFIILKLFVLEVFSNDKTFDVNSVI